MNTCIKIFTFVFRLCIFNSLFSFITAVLSIWTPQKPLAKHQCPFCPYSSNKTNNLENHKRIHTGERPFQCNICLKSFAQKAHLKTHFRSHTGERPFACVLCSKSFSKKIYLKSHKCF